MKTILQKFISQSGYCSRRQAEELIRAGEVLVNGKKAELGQRADEQDRIEIDGKRLEAIPEKIYIALNKPAGYTCTNRIFAGEKNIFELLPAEYYNLHAAGRLDKNSRGLLLLTNDGDFTLKVTHPRYGHEKRYRVSISKFKFQISKQFLNDLISKFKSGIDIGEGDGVVHAKNIKYLQNNEFEITLNEGKKRQIRRMFKALGYEVEDLQRIAIGRFTLDGLREGEWKLLDN